MRTSESINELAAALAKAQGVMGGAKKDAANPFFKSSYADLASVVAAVKEPFAANGLSYAQGLGSEWTESGTLMVRVTTRLMHSSGQWLEDSCLIKPVKDDPQSFGSATTYARRYGLQAMAGIPSEDDDANQATRPGGKQPEATIDDARAAALDRLKDALVGLWKNHPKVLTFPPSLMTDEAKKARLAIISQVLGRDLVSINGLGAEELDRAASEIKRTWPW